MRLLLFASLLAFAACGENVEPDPGAARSGSRLALHRYVYDEGVAEVETRWFHDLAREERCTPRRWSDGVTYCTPDAAAAVYITPECTQLHARISEGDPAPTYGLRYYWLDRSWHPSRLFRVLGPTRPAELYWELRDGACLGPYSGDGFEYYALGDEIDRAELVQVTTRELPPEGRLALSVHTSADGLYVPISLRDVELDVACTLDERPGATATVCTPDDAEPARYFHDPSCEQLAIVVGTGQELPSRVSYRDARTGCTTYHPVGSALDAPPGYHHIDGTCVDVVPTSGRSYLAGPALALATLARAPVPGAARIQPIEVREGALRLRDPLLHDAELAIDCRRTELGGERYCLPAATVDVVSLFADATCATPISIAMARAGACVPEARFATALGTDGPTLHALETPYTGALFHISTGEQCVPYMVRADHAAYTIGPALPRSTFARAELVVDP